MQYQEPISCEWQPLRDQLLAQWRRLSIKDLEEAGPDNERIAQLITRKYGVPVDFIKSYLHYFEDIFQLEAKHKS
jgi:hypothetical protein